jgi:PKD repeat protein
VMFQDKSYGTGSGIAERLWIFETGQTSTLPNPVYQFGVTDTTYLVTLIVTDTYGCQDTITNSIYVKPGFAFTFNNDTVCFGNPTHFTPENFAQGDSLFFVTWDFGDPESGPGNISHVYSPVHTFTHAGTFIVKMKASNWDNCADSVYKPVTVHGLPQVLFTASSQPCDNIVHFTDSTVPGSGSITRWEWNFGDGTSPVIILSPGPGNVDHTYASTGDYTVILKVTNSYGCEDSFSAPVHMAPCISASFTQENLLCARCPITFNDNSVPVSSINSWHWLWGDGSDTTYSVYASKVTHIFANPGSYLVKLVITATVGSDLFSDTAMQQIQVGQSPQALFSGNTVCLDKTTFFRDSSATFGEPIISWKWNFGDPASGLSNNSSFQNPSHKFDSAGTYPVKLVVTNRFGCKDSLVKSTRVFGLPVAHFENTNACEGNPTNFTDLSVPADTAIMSWRWNFGVGGTMKDTSGIQDPIYKYKNEGNYLVRLIVTDHNGCLDTIDSTIMVYVSPMSAFTFIDNFNGMPGRIKLNNQSTGAISYEWEFGNGTSSTEENPVTTFTLDGTYLIMLVSTNQYNCTDTAYYNYEMLFKGLFIPNAFSPTNSNQAIRLFKPVGRNLKQYNIQVYDNVGHLLWESSLLDGEGRPVEGWDGTFNGRMMPQATYMWKVNAIFIDDSVWKGSDIGTGEYGTMGTVSLIR